MNFLAHLFLSPADDHARLGSIMGDFLRGVDKDQLPPRVQLGIDQHLAIDAYTDEHEIVKDLRRLFSRERRRFSGVALDVVFDHYLIKHWLRFSQQAFDPFVDECYSSLRRQEQLMPARMQHVTSWMMDHDWLRSYAQLSGIGRALDGLAGRLKQEHGFHGIIEEVVLIHDDIDAGFQDFFPQLISYSSAFLQNYS